jgi:hypothetical protein
VIQFKKKLIQKIELINNYIIIINKFIMSKFRIEKVKLLCVKGYNLIDKDLLDCICTICRNNINNDSIYNTNISVQSLINIGICGHIYHDDCIIKWLVTNDKCPLCSQLFVSNYLF